MRDLACAGHWHSLTSRMYRDILASREVKSLSQHYTQGSTSSACHAGLEIWNPSRHSRHSMQVVVRGRRLWEAEEDKKSLGFGLLQQEARNRLLVSSRTIKVLSQCPSVEITDWLVCQQDWVWNVCVEKSRVVCCPWMSALSHLYLCTWNIGNVFLQWQTLPVTRSLLLYSIQIL